MRCKAFSEKSHWTIITIESFDGSSDGAEVDDRSGGRFIDPRAISARPDTAILINNRQRSPKRIGSIFYSHQPMKHLLSRARSRAPTREGKREEERGCMNMYRRGDVVKSARATVPRPATVRHRSSRSVIHHRCYNARG